MDIEAWLRQLGLSDYAEVFRANHVSFDVLPSLSAEDLVEIGVRSVGHRRKLLDAIGRLGNELPSVPRPAEELPDAGERRQVTVLFADIAGFTGLSAELDAEQVHRLLAAFFEQVDAIVVALGGRIDKHIGDCVMAVFGAPIAHDDDVRRAALAAVRAHAAMAAVSAVAGRAIATHVGIATGEVVASRTGSSSFLEYTVTGDTVNLASRLADIAGPGQTVVTGEVVSALGEAFEGTPLPERPIRGFARRIGLWTLAAVRSQETVRQLPMIGRRSELNLCLALIRELSQSGAGANLVVVGEPGIGKTRLVDEIGGEAVKLGVRVVRAALVDFGAGLDQDPTSQIAVELDRLAGGEAAPAESSLSLKALLRQPLTQPERSLLTAMPEPQRVAMRAEALVAIAQRAGTAGPLLILVEDVHWASPQVRAALDRLARAIAQTVRAVLLVTTRPSETGRALLDGVPSTVIELGPLKPQEASALARLHLADASAESEALVGRAGGNPLFLEQLIRHSLQGASAGALPGSIRSIMLARIDQLRPRDKLALQTLAVLGDEPAAEAQGTLLAQDGLDTGVLVRQRFLQHAGDGVRFAHALIREVCYGAMLKPQRVALHRKAAAWFAGRDPVLYAQHLARGEDAGAALAFLEAARHLQEALRLEEALDCLGQGLAVAADDPGRHRLSLARGDLLLALARPREAIESFERAEATAPDVLAKATAQLGRAGALRLIDGIDAALALIDGCVPVFEAAGAEAMLSRLEHLRGNLHFPRGEMDACAAAHRRALTRAERAGSAELEAQALGGMGDAAYARGLYVTASRHFSACLDRARALGLGRIELANRPMQVISSALSGTMGGALAGAEEAIRQAIEARQPRAELIARHAAMISHLWAGRPALVAQHFEAAQAIVERIGARRFEPENIAFMAEARRQIGEAGEARRLLEQALAICRETGMSYFGAIVLALTALAADEPARRREALEEAERLAGSGLAHNAWFFGCYAIESALEARSPVDVERYCDAFESRFAEEPLPIVEALVGRGRLLARNLDGVPASELRAEAATCRDRIHALEIAWFAKALEGLAEGG